MNQEPTKKKPFCKNPECPYRWMHSPSPKTGGCDHSYVVQSLSGDTKCLKCGAFVPEAKTSDEIVEEAMQDFQSKFFRFIPTNTAQGLIGVWLRSTLTALVDRVREEARRQGQIDNAISLDAAMIHDLKNAKVGDKAHALLQSVRKEGALAVLADLEGKYYSEENLDKNLTDIIASLRASIGEK